MASWWVIWEGCASSANPRSKVRTWVGGTGKREGEKQNKNKCALHWAGSSREREREMVRSSLDCRDGTGAGAPSDPTRHR